MNVACHPTPIGAHPTPSPIGAPAVETLEAAASTHACRCTRVLPVRESAVPDAPCVQPGSSSPLPPAQDTEACLVFLLMSECSQFLVLGCMFGWAGIGCNKILSYNAFTGQKLGPRALSYVMRFPGLANDAVFSLTSVCPLGQGSAKLSSKTLSTPGGNPACPTAHHLGGVLWLVLQV